MKNKLQKTIYMLSQYFLYGFMLQLLLLNFGLPINAKGQYKSIDKVIINLPKEEMTVSEFFKEVQRQTPFAFSYDSKKIDRGTRLTFENKKGTVEDFLVEASKQGVLSFRQINHSIDVKRDERRSIAAILSEDDDPITVTGKVTDENGDPMPGVTVSIQGTTLGTATNLEGVYSLSAPEGSILVFSFIGYLTKQVPLNNRSTIDISLAPDVRSLNEVVVTAIGMERDKKSLGYSIQEVDNEDLIRSREPSIVSAMSGKVAGVQITSSSGAVGSPAQIRIRGSASLTGNNSPLFVVDGIPINNSQSRTQASGDGNAGVTQSSRSIDINPNDILSMTVLKGPAATALYGIRAASGAVIITTKRGQRSEDGHKTQINYSTAYNVNQINRYQEIQKRYAQGTEVNGVPQYLDPSSNVIESFGPDVSTLTYSNLPSNYNRQGLIVSADNPASNGIPVEIYDNPANFFVNGHTFDNHLSMTGGSEKANYYFSLGNLSQKGIIPTEEFNRSSFKISGDVSLSPKLIFSSSASYVKSGGNRVQQGSNSSGVMMGVLRGSPITFDIMNGYKDPVNEPLSYSFLDGTQRNPGGGGGGYDNPYWSLRKINYNDEVDRLIGFSQVEYDVFPWLKATGRVGVDYFNEVRVEKISANSRSFMQGRISEHTLMGRDINSDLILTATMDLTSDFNTVFVVGHNFFNSKGRTQRSEGTGLTIPDFGNISGASTQNAGASISQKKLNAAYVDARLSYKAWLFFNFTGRNEWSSTLPSNNNSIFYPAISTSFAFTDAFQIKSPFLTFGKLRASFAEVGNDAPIYALDNIYSTAGVNSTLTSGGIRFPYQNNLGLTVNNNAGNPILRPEITISTELGGEFRFFNDKFSADITWYSSISKDQIVRVPLPASSGFGSTILNAGEVRNKGIEVVLGATPVERNGFVWDVTLNWSRNVSEVTKIADGLESIALTTVGPLGQIRLVSGQPYGIIYVNDYLRDGSGNILIDDNELSNESPNPNYGFPFRDPEQSPQGDINPDWIAGLRNVFTYRNFSLSTLIDLRQGFDIYNATRGSMNQNGTTKETEDRYSPTVFPGIKRSDDSINDISVIKGSYWYTGAGGGFGSGIHSQFIEDGSWIRLREVTLGYQIPSSWLNKIYMSNASISLFGRNLLLLTEYSGGDPETNLNGDNNSGGYDYFTIPGTKSYGIALNVTF